MCMGICASIRFVQKNAQELVLKGCDQLSRGVNFARLPSVNFASKLLSQIFGESLPYVYESSSVHLPSEQQSFETCDT